MVKRVLSMWVVLCSLAGLSQNGWGAEPTVQISMPGNGMVVAPGQAVAVSVATTGKFQAIFMSGQPPLPPWFDTASVTSPYQFQIDVPSQIPPGKYTVLATVVIVPGAVVDSAPLTLDVEYSASAARLTSDTRTLFFRYVGDQRTIDIYATFGSAPPITVNHSARITYLSNDTSIATVDGTGLVTATGAGTTELYVVYGGQSITIPIVVPQAGAGDLNADGKVDIDDMNILNTWVQARPGMIADGPNDARDLNHDGMINTLDLMSLSSLCVYPGCATHSGQSFKIGAAFPTPGRLWPPNGKMVPVYLTVPTSGSAGESSCAIAWVASNEPIDPGGDWIITGALSLNLVAQRLGSGNGRIYTVEVECTDQGGNSATQGVQVTVPHDQGN